MTRDTQTHTDHTAQHSTVQKEDTVQLSSEHGPQSPLMQPLIHRCCSLIRAASLASRYRPTANSHSSTFNHTSNQHMQQMQQMQQQHQQRSGT